MLSRGGKALIDPGIRGSEISRHKIFLMKMGKVLQFVGQGLKKFGVTRNSGIDIKINDISLI